MSAFQIILEINMLSTKVTKIRVTMNMLLALSLIDAAACEIMCAWNLNKLAKNRDQLRAHT